jgi:2-dehydro-3-deoxyglucarate aldolase
MGRTKEKLRAGDPVLGGWIMIGHPSVAEILAGEGFDWLVVCMLEHVDAVKNVDAILAVPGIDATFIGPYDLSASMGLPGQTNHPEVLEAQRTLLAACNRHRVPAGIHVVPVDGGEVKRRIEEGFRFMACGIDTGFLLFAARRMLEEIKRA